MTTIQMGGSGNIFRMNTMHKMGASATLNPGNEALIELNNMIGLHNIKNTRSEYLETRLIIC